MLATGSIDNTVTVSSPTSDPNPGNNTSVATTTINTSADLSVVKTDSPDPVVAGETLTYTIVVDNAGPSVAQAVTLTDAVPVSVQNPEYSTDGGATWNTWIGTLALGNLLVGNKSIEIRGIVSPSATGTINNTATVSSPTPDPDPSNNTSSTTTQIGGSADLSIEKTDSPDPVIAGNTLTYTLVVTNAGPSAAVAVTVTDTVPTNLQNPEYSTDGGSTWHPWTGTLALGNLGIDSITIQIRGTVDPGTSSSISSTAMATSQTFDPNPSNSKAIADLVITEMINNIATVSSLTPDPNPNNNTSTVTTTVDTLADLSIVKTDSPDPVIAGHTITYTLVVSNAGPSTAQLVTLTDTVSSNIQNPEYSTDGGATWSAWTGTLALGSLAVGNTTILVRGVVVPAATGVISNTATISSPMPDPDPTNDTSTVDTTVTTSADGSISKVVSPDPMIAGTEATYTIIVTNNGPSDAENVVVSDAVGIQNAQYSTDGGATWSNWTGSISLGTVHATSSQELLIKGIVSASATGEIVNTATMISTTSDPYPSNDTVTIHTPVNTLADIVITKSAQPNPLVAGQMGTYTLTVTNAGPSDAGNVVVNDLVSLQAPEYSLDNGITWLVWIGSVVLGTMPTGTSQTILIRGIVSASAADNTTNTAKVESTTPVKDPAHSAVTITTPITRLADLSIGKVMSSSPVVAGNQAIYTLTVTNAGPSDAQGVIVSDTVDLQNSEYSLDNGNTWLSWTGSINLGTVALNAIRTILIRGKISSANIGSLVNTATVEGQTSDPDPTNNTVTITTVVTTLADVLVTKSVDPNPMVAGSQATYRITATNNGPSDAGNVVINDAVNLQNPQYKVGSNGAWLPWTGSVNIGTLGAGVTQSIWIRGIVNVGASTMTNTVVAQSNTQQIDPAHNTATIITPITTRADMRISKGVSPNPVIAGQKATYTLTATNNGPSDAVNVVINDIVDLQNPQYSLDSGMTWLPWIGSVNLGTVVVGEVRTVLITGVVSTLATDTLTNTATLSSMTPPVDPTHNTVMVTAPVTTLADMRINKVATPMPIIAGETVTYTIIATNNGPSDAVNVVLNDPVDLQVPQYSVDGGITWASWMGSMSLGTVPVGTTRSILVRGSSDATKLGMVTNTATLSSTTPPVNPAHSTVTITTPVNGIANMSISKRVDPNPVVAGQEATYTLTVTNSGPSDAQNVSVNDMVNLQNPEYNIDNSMVWAPWLGNVTVGTIPAGITRTIKIRGTVSPVVQGTITNTATVGSTTTNPDPSKTTAMIVIPVNTLANLQVNKTITNPQPALRQESVENTDGTTVVPGVIIFYMITVNNAGPSDAQNVVLNDQVDLDNPQYILNGGNKWIPWTGSVNLGTIVAGAMQFVNIQGIVKASAVDVLMNTATASSTTQDPDPTHNTSTVIIPVQTSADVSISKSISPSVVTAGDLATYTLIVMNSGPSNAQGVVVNDSVDLDSAEYSVDNGASWLPWLGSVSLGTMVVGEVIKVMIRGIVNGAVLDTLTNTANVVSITPDPVPGNNTATANAVVNVIADLSVAQMISPAPVNIGDTMEYTIVITNGGPSDAQDVNMTNKTPEGIANPQYSLDNGMTWLPWPGHIDLGMLPAGSFQTVLIKGQVTNLAPDKLVNTVSITSSTPVVDENKTTDTKVNVVNRIQMTESADRTGVVMGDTITYTIVISNQGQTLVEDMVVTDPLTAMLKYRGNLKLNGEPISGNITEGVIIQTLDPGQVVTLTFDTQVVGMPEGRMIITQSTADYMYRATQTGPALSDTITSNTVEVRVYKPKFSMIKSTNDAYVVVGESFAYTIEVTNNGDIEFNQVILTDELPVGFGVQNITVDGISVNGDIEVGIPIGPLGVGQIKEVEVAVKVNDKVSIANFNNLVEATGTAITDPTKPPYTITSMAEDQIGVAIYNPVAVCKKSADKKYVVVGEKITYTIVVTNEAHPNLNNVPLEDVKVIEDLPSELEFVPGTVTVEGISLVEASILAGIAIGTLLINQTKTITFVAKAISDQDPTIVNVVTTEYSYQIPE